jgi:hypothetical protein
LLHRVLKILLFPLFVLLFFVGFSGLVSLRHCVKHLQRSLPPLAGFGNLIPNFVHAYIADCSGKTISETSLLYHHCYLFLQFHSLIISKSQNVYLAVYFLSNTCYRMCLRPKWLLQTFCCTEAPFLLHRVLKILLFPLFVLLFFRWVFWSCLFETLCQTPSMLIASFMAPLARFGNLIPNFVHAFIADCSGKKQFQKQACPTIIVIYFCSFIL